MPAITITLADRVRMYTEAVRTTREKAKLLVTEEQQALDQLAMAEAAVLNHAPGWEGIQLSGLIEEGKNPYYTPPKREFTAAERAAAAGIGKEPTMERPAEPDEPDTPDTPDEPDEDDTAKHAKHPEHGAKPKKKEK